MVDKKPIDLKTFVENVNKKDKKRNGLKIRFAFFLLARMSSLLLSVRAIFP